MAQRQRLYNRDMVIKMASNKNSAGPIKDHKILVFIPEHNSHGKRDVTGAFKPEAVKLLKLAGGAWPKRVRDGWVGAGGSRIITFDNHLPMAKRRKAVLKSMGERAHEDRQSRIEQLVVMAGESKDGVLLRIAAKQLGVGERTVRRYNSDPRLEIKGGRVVATKGTEQ